MNNFSNRDKKIIWHPFSQEKTAGLPLAIQSGKGGYLFDFDNTAYLDLISSWWVNLHGHAHPVIAKAIYEQALKLEQVIFSKVTHEPAVVLSEMLQAILPSSLSRFFFSDNGSTAIEAALKMAYQYWHNQGKTKKKFACFEGGYHGDTIGAMSVGKSSGYHDVFKPLLFEVITLPYPDTWIGDFSVEAREQEAYLFIKDILEKNHENISALILEPLIQGASGMRMCRRVFLNKIIKLVKSYDILVIFDEVMTGFGRTGTTFALEQLDLASMPDILCLAKGLTGGFLPLALTIATEKIYEAFLDDKISKAFLHGHSYTANPLGCAAGIASLEILLSTETQQGIKNISQAHQAGLSLLQSVNGVTRVRQLGSVSAFTLINSKLNLLVPHLLQQGFLVRPLHNTLYLLPPYCVSVEELNSVYQAIYLALGSDLDS